MDTVSINNKEYYNGNSLLQVHEKIFKGCRNSRALIVKYKLTDDDYTFASEIKGKWNSSDGSSRKCDKLFVSTTWVNNYLPNVENIEDAPEIIILDDNEKFKDNDGNILEIETRGERIHDKCYFRLRDVAKGFEMKNLRMIILDSRKKYNENIHYKYFMCKSVALDNNTTYKKVFLTYHGMLKVLFSSRSGTAEKFTSWATCTLFTIQLGTKQDKKILSSSLLGTSVSELKAVFSKTSYKVPALYLFGLGKVKDLRKTFNIGKEYKDDQLAGKIGMSIDLARRGGEHEADYGKMKNVSVRLMHYNYIDPQYISSAETDLKDILGGLNLMFKHPIHTEIIIFDMKQLRMIKKQYEQIGKMYIGHISELVTKIKDLESSNKIKDLECSNKIKELESSNKIKELESRNKIKELESSNKINELENINKLMKKDLEIANLKRNKK